ncbi:MAG: hypothetical protein LBR13_04620 [Dysgonamonadaceae bacterium]|jgi:hypothetical protein|nr:hypothetical protein [Dysgonamonadaceae bacterium]
MFCKEIANTNISEAKTEGLLHSSIDGNAPITEALHLMCRNNAEILKVRDEKGEYLGAISRKNLLQNLDSLLNSFASGSIIAVEAPSGEIVASRLIHIVESHNAHVMSYLTHIKNDRETVLMKTDSDDATAIVRSLARFDYDVVYCSAGDVLTDDLLISRANELIRYIEI